MSKPFQFNKGVTLEAIRARGKGTMVDALGVEFTEVGPDYLRAEIVVDARHLRPGGIMNGGTSLALIEIVGSTAANCCVPDGKNCLGIQVSANHLAVAVPGDRLTTTASPIHVGNSTHVWQVDIKNQKDRLVSSGRITMLVAGA